MVRGLVKRLRRWVCFRPLTGMVRCRFWKSWTRFSFRPLTGMVPHPYYLRYVQREVFAPLRGWYDKDMGYFHYKAFSPPYGDGTNNELFNYDRDGFSPPYGDGTTTQPSRQRLFMFSPPYGDGTATEPTHRIKFVFSPPYGDSTRHRGERELRCLVFAPLRG